MTSVLFVCTANICRSAYAELVAAHRTFVLQERPAAVRRAFTLGQLASALDEVADDVVGKEQLSAARRARPTARPEDDVADPYGRGPEAAASAAAHIDALLARVLPRVAPG